MSFSLSSVVNPPTVFLVKRSRLRGRLDAEYNFALLTSQITSKYPHRKLREIASFRTGGTPNKSRPEYWEGEIPWASPKDFRFFYLTDTEDHISKEALLESATTLVPPGTLLVVFRSGILQHTLPVTITTNETAINQDLKAIIFGSDVSAEYVGAYFVVFSSRLLPLITKSGATVQSINTEQFEQLEIPILPKEVQDAVVTKLLGAYKTKHKKEDQAQQLIANIDTVLLDELGIKQKTGPPNKLKDRVFRSHLHELTSRRWDPNYYRYMARFLKEIESCLFSIHKLKDALDLVQYGISERATADVTGVPMLRMLNLQDGDWDVSDMKYIVMDERARQPYLLKERCIDR
ncbi:MAG: hypothetical protein DMF67_18945 [Acidobacteria bacterium]|nr:MAG: hypothetical protein DMF66_02650 [Acidobacteriota bacterium]PYS80841.1 MAG: hypothetical protein DMF67_18945 [Acidobacteriota bacterium]